MKIAIITEDGATVSQHFGRAPFYLVITVEDGSIHSQERRAKAGHHTFAAQEQTGPPSGERHGYDAGSQVKHNSMADTISDCQVLIAGGMGWGAFDSLKSRNIEPVVTDVRNINEALKLYLSGRLTNLMERLH